MIAILSKLTTKTFRIQMNKLSIKLYLGKRNLHFQNQTLGVIQEEEKSEYS